MYTRKVPRLLARSVVTICYCHKGVVVAAAGWVTAGKPGSFEVLTGKASNYIVM
jgi:hypothetical protein